MIPPDGDGPGVEPRAVQSPPLPSDGPRDQSSTSPKVDEEDLGAARHDLLLRTAGAPFIVVGRDRTAQRGERSTGAWSLMTIDDAVECARSWSEAGGDVYTVRNRVAGGQLYVRHHAMNCRRSGCDCPRAAVEPCRLGNPPQLVDIAQIGWLPIDIDPADGADLHRARDHARRLLDDLDRHVPLALVLDSGRGLQSGVRLDPRAGRDDDVRWASAISLARRIETWLRGRADGALVKIDTIANVNRFTRLAGFRNTKTGRSAQVLKEFDGAVVDPRAHLPGVISRAGARGAGARTGEGGTRGPVLDCEWRNEHIAGRLASLGHTPSARQLSLLNELDALNEEGCAPALLSHRFLAWAQVGAPDASTPGADYPALQVNSDASDRMVHFAAAALCAQEALPGIMGALVDPSFKLLNQHWLDKGLDSWRAATRAVVWAIAQTWLWPS